MREGLIRDACALLLREGYVAFYCSGTRTCFDLVARRGGELLLVKVLENIDGFMPGQAHDLKKIGLMFGARYLLLGGATKEGELDDGVVYERHGIPCLSLGTFSDMITGESYPSAWKFKALTVSVDGRKLAEKRREMALSLSELAEKAGISRETLYRYEHEKVGASEKNVEKLERLLDAEIRKPINPFERADKMIDEKTILSTIGFRSVRASSAPFDIAAKEKSRVIAGEEMDMRTLKKRAGIYGKISETFESSACFLLRKSAKDAIEGIPVVRADEVKGMRKPRDLLKLIEERGE